jgi:hypothetical protein
MLKSKETALSKNWVVTKRHGAAYTGGAVSLCDDGRTAACLCADRVALLDLESGAVARIIPEDVAVSAASSRICGLDGVVCSSQQIVSCLPWLSVCRA